MQTWVEKLNCTKEPKKKMLEKSVSGMQAGDLMYISTPKEIEAYIDAIPKGQCVTIKKMRQDLATKNSTDCTCPLTTGIYLRIVAEAALEKSAQGMKDAITPFWRVISPDDKIAEKLSCGIEYIQNVRKKEGIA